jgi:hypothetical protein
LSGELLPPFFDCGGTTASYKAPYNRHEAFAAILELDEALDKLTAKISMAWLKRNEFSPLSQLQS